MHHFAWTLPTVRDCKTGSIIMQTSSVKIFLLKAKQKYTDTICDRWHSWENGPMKIKKV